MPWQYGYNHHALEFAWPPAYSGEMANKRRVLKDIEFLVEAYYKNLLEADGKYYPTFRMRYYVYALVDPRDAQPFYIGKGTGDRMYQHDKEARLGLQTPKCIRIRDIWAAGADVERRTIGWFSDNRAAHRFETETIDDIGRRNLTN